MQLIQSKTSGELKWIFRDTDTLALDDTKLSVTETDYNGDAQSWERTDITTDDWELITATAEEYIIARILILIHTVTTNGGNYERRNPRPNRRNKCEARRSGENTNRVPCSVR